MLKNFNNNLLDSSDYLLLAVSGGIDSMVMLHYLNEVKNTLNVKIAVAHFDHQKRKESFLDCQLVVDTCKKLSIECFTSKLVDDSTRNFHDYARTMRYNFFYETARKIGANKIVLAHNANDNAETILMRLTRGSSFEGYRGILEKTYYRDLQIIRPLLEVSRNEISKYQKENNVLYNEDSSNQEDHYTRNRYRHHVLPFLEQENPRYLEKFKQFSEYLEYAYKLIEKLSNDFIDESLTKHENQYEIHVDEFEILDEIIKIDVIKKVVNIQSNNTIELTYKNIQDILSLLSNKKPHLELQISNSLIIYKSYNSVYFTEDKKETKDYSLLITELCEVSLPNGKLIITDKNPNKYYGIMFKLCYNNLDLILPLRVRNRRDGDKIKTSSGTKKIKDVFINKKIPLDTRNRIPILLNNQDEIIWIPKIHKTKSTGDNILYIIYQEG